jgi:hypothetical protein
MFTANCSEWRASDVGRTAPGKARREYMTVFLLQGGSTFSGSNSEPGRRCGDGSWQDVMLSAGNIFFWTLWATCLCGLGVLAMLGKRPCHHGGPGDRAGADGCTDQERTSGFIRLAHDRFLPVVLSEMHAAFAFE